MKIISNYLSETIGKKITNPLLSKCGFSTLELAVVLGIVGILSSVAIPSYLSWRANYQLKAAAREVNTVFQRTRMEVISQNKKLTILFENIFNSDMVRYRVFEDNGAGAFTSNQQVDVGEVVYLDDTIENVAISNATNNMSVLINSRGIIMECCINGIDTTLQNGSIILNNNSSERQFKILFFVTGHTKITVV
ncbi:MAG: hypothetical protein OEM02_01175 [Desulfobulbaceae bacterium]|nr:hypothetical protein [Desulfobulbaceae bacterium]